MKEQTLIYKKHFINSIKLDLSNLLQQVQQKIYCYWDAKSTVDSVIVILNMIVTLAILVIAIKNLHKAIKLLDKAILIIYSLAVLWGLFYLAKDIFSIASFFSILQYSPEKSTLTNYSKAYSVTNAIPAIIVQTLLIIIPYRMCGGVMNQICKNQGHIPKLQFKVYQLIKTYFFVRIYLIIPLIMIIISSQTDVIGIFCTLKLILQLIDTFVCCMILGFALWIFNKYYTKLDLKTKQKIQLKRQLILLQVCSVSRFVGNIFFLQIMPLLISQQKQQDCIQPFTQHPIFTFGYLLIGSYLMHFIPIFTICRVYKPDKPQRIFSRQFSINGNNDNLLQSKSQQIK